LDDSCLEVASPDSRRLCALPSDAGRRDAFTRPDLGKEQLLALMREFEADVREGRHRERGWPSTCYGMSKLAVIAYTKILAR
jgi:carbonyl reductase 1